MKVVDLFLYLATVSSAIVVADEQILIPVIDQCLNQTDQLSGDAVKEHEILMSKTMVA
jgi:hypothetical protein